MDTTADTAVTRVATAVVTEVVEARPATLAVAMAIYPEIALKARSATTVGPFHVREILQRTDCLARRRRSGPSLP